MKKGPQNVEDHKDRRNNGTEDYNSKILYMGILQLSNQSHPELHIQRVSDFCPVLHPKVTSQNLDNKMSQFSSITLFSNFQGALDSGGIQFF